VALLGQGHATHCLSFGSAEKESVRRRVAGAYGIRLITLFWSVDVEQNAGITVSPHEPAELLELSGLADEHDLRDGIDLRRYAGPVDG
jgi:hypothetical protein